MSLGVRTKPLLETRPPRFGSACFVGSWKAPIFIRTQNYEPYPRPVKRFCKFLSEEVIVGCLSRFPIIDSKWIGAAKVHKKCSLALFNQSIRLVRWKRPLPGI